MGGAGSYANWQLADKCSINKYKLNKLLLICTLQAMKVCVCICVWTVNESFAYYITLGALRKGSKNMASNRKTTAHALKTCCQLTMQIHIMLLYIHIGGTPFIAAVDKARERFTTLRRSLDSLKPVKLVSHSAGRPAKFLYGSRNASTHVCRLQLY